VHEKGPLVSRAETRHVVTRVLLLEHEPRSRESLCAAISREGFDVSTATDHDLAEQARRGNADVILLCFPVPDGDGFELCRSVRRSSHVPIIILAPSADSHDVVAGLETGADDYVVKPAVPKELAARIRAVLRRTAVPERHMPASGALEIRVPERQVVCEGEPVAVTPTEFALLAALSAEQGAAVGREDLLRRVWGHDFVSDTRLLDVHVSRLRSKIEDDPSRPRRLVTVRGHGYRLES
jgi:two-component system response regulator MtrA